MKRVFLLTLCLGMLFVLGACDQVDNDITTPVSDPIPDVTTGDVHTEFFDILHEQYQLKSANSTQVTDACTSVANQLLTKYGLPEMSREDIQGYLNEGRNMATNKSENTMQGVLFGDELAWWDRYSWEARTTNARRVYNQHCRLYGAPKPGSTLEHVMTTVISSCEVWTKYRPEEECYMPTEEIGAEKGWVKNLIRFVVAVGVDGAAGGLAGSAGGPIAGGIVGGLASEGADNILFGD